MSAFAVDWLNLLLRWAHMIAGIGWIGTSFYFIALDLSLKKRETMKEGVLGTAWQVHGGGFYHVEKFTLAPKELPGDLIWFKWGSLSDLVHRLPAPGRAILPRCRRLDDRSRGAGPRALACGRHLGGKPRRRLVRL